MNAKTSEILDIFGQISKIPRCSNNETEICNWLLQWAKDHGFDTRQDKAQNVVIRVPATAGAENRPTIVLQGHVDMVCEKTAASGHDFGKDPIPVVLDGDWVRAETTSLGADNGIALALALSMAADATTIHPPLELLFTTGEETGLNGALNLAEDMIEGKILLNLDSEDEGVFTIGCAGGRITKMNLQLHFEPLSDSLSIAELKVGGLLGGHSGIDINKGRENAIKIMARTLNALQQEIPIQLISLKGGTAHNAIPREAQAIIACPETSFGSLSKMVASVADREKTDKGGIEKGLMISVAKPENASSFSHVVTHKDTQKAINLFMALPHGISALLPDSCGNVRTSTSLASMVIEDETLKFLCSHRSASQVGLDSITQRVSAVAFLAGIKPDNDTGFPPWEPNEKSELLERCRRIYHSLFGEAPTIDIMHAGLECGIIGTKYPGMDMISLGPTIENPHSPDERLHIPSIDRFWRFLCTLLESYVK
ncbi:MAG: beta-Ala-His dipeptidase [Desulfobacteraceae bacterium]|nr:beta-Ala-His dipeptidase [Desulfobacteraceae bacterium]